MLMIEDSEFESSSAYFGFLIMSKCCPCKRSKFKAKSSSFMFQDTSVVLSEAVQRNRILDAMFSGLLCEALHSL